MRASGCGFCGPALLFGQQERETVKLRDVHPGTVVRLEDGPVVVAAVGPGHGRRCVMQESGVMLDTRSSQEVEILDVPWSPHLATLLIKACRG